MDVKVENAVAPVEVPRAAVPAERRLVRPRFLYTGLAVAAIWLASAAASIWTPDMITGSQHEHIPVAAFSFWLYAAIATAFVLMAASAGGQVDEVEASPWSALFIAIASIWGVVATTSIFAPTMVTGTDPTTIPMAAFAAPVAGVLATAFVAVFVAGHAARARG
jgi:hypothetical protein